MKLMLLGATVSNKKYTNSRVGILLNTQDIYLIHHTARGKIPGLEKDTDNENATFDILDNYLIKIKTIIPKYSGMPWNTPQPNLHTDLRDYTVSTGNVNCRISAVCQSQYTRALITTLDIRQITGSWKLAENSEDLRREAAMKCC